MQCFNEHKGILWQGNTARDVDTAYHFNDYIPQVFDSTKHKGSGYTCYVCIPSMPL
eukprot:c44636_g1_i1 orf=1-165(-)